ncbi:MAG: ORF6N domain-containing protein, partial [Erysipelotrichia bacterium]|nr:ORF6N domain-containing protein [Erysipelotrichia bacterium]
MQELIINENNIKDKIHNIRNQQVMLDRDLAELYGVETKVFN